MVAAGGRQASGGGTASFVAAKFAWTTFPRNLQEAGHFLGQHQLSARPLFGSLPQVSLARSAPDVVCCCAATFLNDLLKTT